MSNNLSKVSVGTKVKVKSIDKTSAYRRRLMDMGIIPGLEISEIGRAHV